MERENRKNRGEFLIAYPLQYPLSEEELKCLHITDKDVTWIGKIRRPYYMVPCDDSDLSRECTRQFDNDRKAEARYKRCPNEEFSGVCMNDCTKCNKPRKGIFIPMSYCNKEESEYFSDVGNNRRTEDRIDLEIIIDKVEKENPTYARYLRKLRFMNTSELENSEGKAHSTIIEGKQLAIKLAIKIYNDENTNKGEYK